MKAVLALAETTGTKQQHQQLTLQIQSLTGELKELSARWQILTSKTGGVEVPTPVDHTHGTAPDIELPQETTSGGSRWQTIQFTSNSKSRSDMLQAHSEASTKPWLCNLWLASGSGSSSSSSGASSSS
ncbi:hypothetical protein DFH08DRAFT_977620 [Mycena albidolilacea]|uniref:Uncharacterized protein n=1 Tax=Mycena albidolilacea TaxID=1033008 RepID=A0AAD7E9B2_9AGAR|nr:hypothetical protein DFH08DRAFT_977620 [Mycena albidolilacea]